MRKLKYPEVTSVLQAKILIDFDLDPYMFQFAPFHTYADMKFSSYKQNI